MIAKIWFIRASGAPSSARLSKFSYESILEAIGLAVNPVMGDTIGTLVVISAETHRPISTVTFDVAQMEEQDAAVERVLNEVWVALEEEGRIPQVR